MEDKLLSELLMPEEVEEVDEGDPSGEASCWRLFFLEVEVPLQLDLLFPLVVRDRGEF